MLRIWTLSGAELASLTPDEWKDIKEVKRHLHQEFRVEALAPGRAFGRHGNGRCTHGFAARSAALC